MAEAAQRQHDQDNEKDEQGRRSRLPSDGYAWGLIRFVCSHACRAAFTASGASC